MLAEAIDVRLGRLASLVEKFLGIDLETRGLRGFEREGVAVAIPKTSFAFGATQVPINES